MEMIIIEVPRKRSGRVVHHRPVGHAENNEPLRVRHLFRRWLSRNGVRVIVDLKELNQFGVWEVGLLVSFKREVDQRAAFYVSAD